MSLPNLHPPPPFTVYCLSTRITHIPPSTLSTSSLHIHTHHVLSNHHWFYLPYWSSLLIPHQVIAFPVLQLVTCGKIIEYSPESLHIQHAIQIQHTIALVNQCATLIEVIVERHRRLAKKSPAFAPLSDLSEGESKIHTDT